jgi:hypothetical protein
MTCIVIEICSFKVCGPISSAWRGGVVSWYGVFGSPVICDSRELIIFRIFGP